MIRENRVRAHVDGKHLGQQCQPVLDLLLAVGIVLAGQGTDAAQEMAPDATADEVIERCDICRDQSFSGLRHGFGLDALFLISVAGGPKQGK